VNKKCFIMAKTLQFVCMIWVFINIWFLKFGTYIRKRQKQSNEVGDILKWQREEVTKLQEVLKAEQVLNVKQCMNLVEKLDQVALNMNHMIISTKETTNKFGLVIHKILESHVLILVWSLMTKLKVMKKPWWKGLKNDLE
jgi:hypothetical protein